MAADIRCQKCGHPMSEYGRRADRRIPVGEMEGRKFACKREGCLGPNGKPVVGELIIVRADLEYIGWLMAAYAQSVMNGEAPDVQDKWMKLLWHFAEEHYDLANRERGVIPIGQYLDDGTKVAA